MGFVAEIDYSYYYNMDGTAMWAGMSTANWVFSILISILGIIFLWKVFEKAGKPGWAAIVPIYNAIVMFQVMGFSPWLLLLVLVPILGWIALAIITIVGYFKLAKNFGKSSAFGIGLWLLNTIFMGILAYGDATYKKVD